MRGCKTPDEVKLLREAVNKTGQTNTVVKVIHSLIFRVMEGNMDSIWEALFSSNYCYHGFFKLIVLSFLSKRIGNGKMALLAALLYIKYRFD